MSLFDAIDVSASGMTAERMRMDVVAENIANADSTRAANGQPYRRKEVVLQEIPGQISFDQTLTEAQSSDSSTGGGVRVVGIVDDPSPLRQVYDPSSPDADKNGYVLMPNVNTITEMVDLTTASRGYEANVQTMNAAKSMLSKTLDLLR
jgi:flagellar basal-body rod protein FlgC